MNPAARRVLERVLGITWDYELRDFGHTVVVIGKTALEIRAMNFPLTEDMMRLGKVAVDALTTPECAKAINRAKAVIVKDLKENRHVMERQQQRQEARREGGPGPAV